MAKSINADTGFNIRVNMFVIRCIFKSFKEQLSKELGKEINMDYLYEDMLGIDRQKFQTICGGNNFQITKDQREKMANLFKIDEQYFMENGKMFDVRGMDRQKWKYFFDLQYDVRYNVEFPNNVTEEYRKNVVNALNKEFKKFEEIRKNYDTDNPIFRVSYYCYRGQAYEEETPFQRFTRELKNAEVTGWVELEDNIEELEVCKELLEQHIQYIQALLTISKYKS